MSDQPTLPIALPVHVDDNRLGMVSWQARRDAYAAARLARMRAWEAEERAWQQAVGVERTANDRPAVLVSGGNRRRRRRQ
jgi:ATPase subunit of ABC transporter with duplicated ATPase domains